MTKLNELHGKYIIIDEVHPVLFAFGIEHITEAAGRNVTGASFFKLSVEGGKFVWECSGYSTSLGLSAKPTDSKILDLAFGGSTVLSVKYAYLNRVFPILIPSGQSLSAELNGRPPTSFGSMELYPNDDRSISVLVVHSNSDKPLRDGILVGRMFNKGLQA